MSFVPREVPVRIVNYAIDSRLRDTSRFPDPQRYVVDITTTLRNVVKVELVSAMYPDSGDETYVNLCIPELEGNLESNDGNNRASADVFAQLPLLQPLNLYSSRTHHRSVKLFERPLAKLGRLTLRFQTFDGSPLAMGDHFLRFEIHCCESGSCGVDTAGCNGGGLGTFSDSATAFVLDGSVRLRE